MSDHISIRKLEGTWVVRAGGAVLAESQNALELAEGDYPVVVYLPREDVATAFLDRTDCTTHCPHKGDASYFSVVTKSQALENAAWSYENPIESVARIKDHLAFHTSADLVVERV